MTLYKVVDGKDIAVTSWSGLSGTTRLNVAKTSTVTKGYMSLYQKRKEKIERVFADAKEKHAMRYTQYRGLAQVTNWVRLKFTDMNKKLARWK